MCHDARSCSDPFPRLAVQQNGESNDSGMQRNGAAVLHIGNEKIDNHQASRVVRRRINGREIFGG